MDGEAKEGCKKEYYEMMFRKHKIFSRLQIQKTAQDCFVLY